MNLKNIDMQEVTRLTRTGRLAEALALLRGVVTSTDTGVHVVPVPAVRERVTEQSTVWPERQTSSSASGLSVDAALHTFLGRLKNWKQASAK